MNIEGSDLTISIGTILGALGAVGSGVLLARRKISRDMLEIAKDRAEIDIINILKSQRDDAVNERNQAHQDLLNANSEKLAALAKIHQLEVEIGQLRQRVTILKQLVGRLSTALDMTKDQLNQIAVQRKPINASASASASASANASAIPMSRVNAILDQASTEPVASDNQIESQGNLRPSERLAFLENLKSLENFHFSDTK